MLIKLKNKNSKNDTIKQFFEVAVFFVIPIAYIVGSFSINLITVLISLYLIFLIIQKKIIFEKKEIFFFLFIVIFFITNSLLADLKNYSLLKSITYLRFILLLYFGIYFLTISELQLKKFFSLLLMSVIIFTSFDAVIQYIYQVDLFGNRLDNTVAYARLSGPFGDEYIVGIYLFCFGFISFALLKFFFNISRFKEVIYISLLSTIIFLTGERNAFLCTILFLFFLFLTSKNIRLTVVISSLVIFASCFLILKNSKGLSERYTFNLLPNLIIKDYNTNQKTENDKSNKLKINNYSSIKYKVKIITNSHWFRHYTAGIEIFKKNILVGSGFKSFRYECKKLKVDKEIICTTHPHNIYIELISDTGVIGLLIFLSFIIYIIFYFYKKKLYKNDFEAIIFSIMLAFIFPLKPHGSIFSTNNAFMIWYILIFLIWGFFYKSSTKLNNKTI
jgi:hypothetical protein|tara:strand:+ start:3378 stop:4715 length:1338 start_codon:yes stop_codon:yes gene_type:complete